MTSPPVSPLIINGCPSNIRLPEGSRATHVESDLHDIAGRLLELGPPRLHLELLEHADGRAVWAVCETDESGVEYLVFRVGKDCEIDALDGRVIERVQYLRHVPLNERLAHCERQIENERKAREAAKAEQMYDNLGSTLYSNLARLGFIDTRVESLRPQNATARRAGRKGPA